MASTDALAAIRIGNFGRVNDNYYRGEQPHGDEYRELAALGVKTVIDLQKDFERDEQRRVEAAGMRYERIEMTASRAPSPEDVERFLALVNDPASQPVFVHCKAGRHRTGAMTAVYRMTKDGWTADQAYAEMKAYKFKMPLNFLLGKPEMKKFVYRYYDNMQEQAQALPVGGN
ncbi:MAG: fused DSP-PTPase phosphatase/NAD kinase-like protein [Longimicrobiales bacterium]